MKLFKRYMRYRRIFKEKSSVNGTAAMVTAGKMLYIMTVTSGMATKLVRRKFFGDILKWYQVTGAVPTWQAIDIAATCQA